MNDQSRAMSIRFIAAGLMAAIAIGIVVFVLIRGRSPSEVVSELDPTEPTEEPTLEYAPRQSLDTAGFLTVNKMVKPWSSSATLKEIAQTFDGAGSRFIAKIDSDLAAKPGLPANARLSALMTKVMLLNYEGDAKAAYSTLEQARALVTADDALAEEALYTIIYLQGVTALRRGENENCIMCRGESSCILPISPAAVHVNPEGSRLAIKHFTEYLERFPDDRNIHWLLNVAHMTLAEHPDKVDPRYLVSLDHFRQNEFDIGRFRDVGDKVKLNLLNRAGGGILEDFDNDGLLDVVITSLDPTANMSYFHNQGTGTFENQTAAAGLNGQLGGLNCVQTDYNNDGWMDVFIVRGAWLFSPIRPSLLRNNKNGTFTDVTDQAGLKAPVNSISSTWADYDNDGWLDLFICCERQASRLYHNLGNGKFEDVSVKSGLATQQPECKGAAWIDYDNDRFPDLFLNFQLPVMAAGPGQRTGSAQLFRNNHNGTFTDVSESLGIDGPAFGFACWAWDYDNDGWQDLFATCYDRTLGDVVEGLKGKPHRRRSSCLYRNLQGKRFEDVTRQAGLDHVYSTMGSNFGDFDNDGWLDMYLGTGEPDLAALVPNRMIKNVDGRRFSEITASSGTGNLQKGHGVACGDWDRDGDTDIFIQMGGASDGDRYHNILFQNPGQGNHWLTVKLVGVKSNRAAIGARIKVQIAGKSPRTIYRHVTSGSSFGANSLQQTIGLSQATRIERLEIDWPTSGTTQVFQDVTVDQALEITESEPQFKKLEWTPIPLPKS